MKAEEIRHTASLVTRDGNILEANCVVNYKNVYMRNHNTGNCIFIKRFDTSEEAAKYADQMNVYPYFKFYTGL